MHKEYTLSEVIRYARRLAIKVRPGEVDDFIAIMRDKIFPSLKNQKGIRRMYLLQTPMQNEFVSLTLWDDKSFADAYGSSGTYTQNVESAREFLESDPILTEFDVKLHDVNAEDLPPPKRARRSLEREGRQKRSKPRRSRTSKKRRSR